MLYLSTNVDTIQLHFLEKIMVVNGIYNYPATVSRALSLTLDRPLIVSGVPKKFANCFQEQNNGLKFEIRLRTASLLLEAFSVSIF